MPKQVKRKKKQTLHGRGETHYKAKVTANQVREMRRIYADGEASYGWLAQEYGLRRGTVADIIKRRTWRSVK